MTDAQRQDVDTLLNSFNFFHPMNLKVEEKNKKDVLVTFQLDDGPEGIKNWYFLGSWDGQQYQWQFQFDGMSKN